MGKLDELTRTLGATIAEQLTSAPTPTSAGASPGLPARLQGLVKAKNIAIIPITKIVAADDQPRETFDPETLNQLANSIRAVGVLQPLVVQWHEEHEYYLLVAGERRWRAAQQAGLRNVPCTIVEEPLDTVGRLILSLLENCMREDVSDLELARCYKKLLDLQNWSAGQLAAELHTPKSTITRRLELLDLPDEIIIAVDQGKIAPSVAAEVGRLESVADQVALAEQVVEQQLTRSDVVARVRERKAERHTPGQSISTGKAKRTISDQSTTTPPVEIAVAGGHKVIIAANALHPLAPDALIEILHLAADRLKDG